MVGLISSILQIFETLKIILFAPFGNLIFPFLIASIETNSKKPPIVEPV